MADGDFTRTTPCHCIGCGAAIQRAEEERGPLCRDCRYWTSVQRSIHFITKDLAELRRGRCRTPPEGS
jgi:hypothetical protein